MKWGFWDLVGILLSGDSLEDIERRQKGWERHVKYEIPKSSDDVKLAYTQEKYVRDTQRS